MVEVVATDEFRDWFEGLSGVEQTAVARMVGMLEDAGVRLGFPHSSALKGTEHPIRELRVKARPIRLLYAFDPRRQAVMLLGGDKTGDDRFYERMIPLAEKVWLRYLAEQAAGLHDKVK